MARWSSGAQGTHHHAKQCRPSFNAETQRRRVASREVRNVREALSGRGRLAKHKGRQDDARTRRQAIPLSTPWKSGGVFSSSRQLVVPSSSPSPRSGEPCGFVDSSVPSVPSYAHAWLAPSSSTTTFLSANAFRRVSQGRAAPHDHHTKERTKL